MSFFSKFFKKDNKDELSPPKTDVNSAIEFENKVGDRFLKLKDTDCGLILHDDLSIDIVFTKFKEYSQSITQPEEALMALALFVKQPGFLATLLEEFKKIAYKNTSSFKVDETNNIQS